MDARKNPFRKLKFHSVLIILREIEIHCWKGGVKGTVLSEKRHHADVRFGDIHVFGWGELKLTLKCQFTCKFQFTDVITYKYFHFKVRACGSQVRTIAKFERGDLSLYSFLKIMPHKYRHAVVDDQKSILFYIAYDFVILLTLILTRFYNLTTRSSTYCSN